MIAWQALTLAFLVGMVVGMVLVAATVCYSR